MGALVWVKMDKDSNKPEVLDHDDVELISETKKSTSNGTQGRCSSVIGTLLCASVLFSCVELSFVFLHIFNSHATDGHLSKPTTLMNQYNNDLKIQSLVESCKMLVSLMASERMSQRLIQNKTKETSIIAIQRYLSAAYKQDNSSVLIASDTTYDVTSGDFSANQDSIEIHKEGLYEVSTIATIKFTSNVTKATHVLYRETTGNARAPLMKKSYRIHADVMAFQQSVLKDTFLLKHGDRLSVFVSGIYGVYEKTTPISLRFIG